MVSEHDHLRQVCERCEVCTFPDLNFFLVLFYRTAEYAARKLACKVTMLHPYMRSPVCLSTALWRTVMLGAYSVLTPVAGCLYVCTCTHMYILFTYIRIRVILQSVAIDV